MKLKVIGFAVLNVLLMAAVVLLMRSCFAPDPVVITREEIKYNTVYRDVYKMPPEDCQQELLCYYTSVPALDIEQINNTDEYTLSAGLCDRKWSRKVQIRPRDSPRNILVTGMLINYGGIQGNVQYYRRIGSYWGLGGGISASMSGASLSGGAVFLW